MKNTYADQMVDEVLLKSFIDIAKRINIDISRAPKEGGMVDTIVFIRDNMVLQLNQQKSDNIQLREVNADLTKRLERGGGDNDQTIKTLETQVANLLSDQHEAELRYARLEGSQQVYKDLLHEATNRFASAD